MQTHFTDIQRQDPNVQEAERVLRSCVHCGFCTATCPTYVLLGNELDSPRGRIYLIKDLLENDKTPTAEVVTHIDRCLSCLSCMTTCPSGVNYMHLVDQARTHIERRFRRPRAERWLRWLLALVLPRPGLFRWALRGARLVRPLGPLMPGRLAGLVAMAPARVPRPSALDRRHVVAAEASRRQRVALLTGCAQRVLDPEINDATIRILNRHGCEVVMPPMVGCCGALTHHLGQEANALDAARTNIGAWWREIEGEGLDAIVINASGCGTVVKGYGHMLRDDPNWAAPAAAISERTRDISELLATLDLAARRDVGNLVVAYHSACSLQHGQKITEPPKALLRQVGFTVRDVPEGHLCCGSAGTYNLLQPAIAARLLERKIGNIRKLSPDVVAAGNIGCMTQIAPAIDVPVVHTAALLDWATGGPKPRALGS